MHRRHDSTDQSRPGIVPRSIDLLPTIRPSSDSDIDCFASFFGLRYFVADFTFLVWFCIMPSSPGERDSLSLRMLVISVTAFPASFDESCPLEIVHQFPYFAWHFIRPEVSPLLSDEYTFSEAAPQTNEA